MSHDTAIHTPVTETAPPNVDNVDTSPLPSDELRQVDQIWLEMLRRQRQSTTQVEWIDSRGILPQTMEKWGAGYMPPMIMDLGGLNRTGLKVGDLLRAGLVTPRKLTPFEAPTCSDPNSKHQNDVDDKDRRKPLSGVRPLLGDRVMVPLRDHKGVVKTWIGRRIHEDKTLAQVAGDYEVEEVDPLPFEGSKYVFLAKERFSGTPYGAQESETYPGVLSPEFIERVSGIDLDAQRKEKKSKFAKLEDKTTPAWVTEGVLDAMLASQGGVASIGLVGAYAYPRQIDWLVKMLAELADDHVPLYICLDYDPARKDRGKAIELGPGQRGTCLLLAGLWARDKDLARHIKVIALKSPDGSKVDLADILRDVYRSIPVPECDGPTPADDMLAMSRWSDDVVAAQKAKLEELAKSSIESIEFLISQVPPDTKPRNRSAALEECGLAAVAAHDEELWSAGSPSEPSVGERVAEILGVDKKERKAWVKSVMKDAAEEAERAEKSSDDDPLARYVNKDGSIRPCWMSCLEILRKEFGTSLKWDEMSLTVVLESVTPSGKKIRQKFDKKQFAKARSKLAKQYKCDVKKIDLEDAVGDLAIEQEVHPVQDWLRGLPKWNEEDHMPALMAALGVTVERGYAPEKVALYTTYMMKTLIAAVARAMEPGCQVDTMLVLQGDQGIKKSSFFRALVPDIAWYGGAGRLDPEAKDSIMGLRKKWILEVAEVDRKSFFSSAAEWKDLITTSVDTLRPPYMRDVEDYPRTSIFMGTTNAEQFLTDPTGARRFWVVPLTLKKLKGEDIDKAAIIKLRDQLWAQAYAAYTAWVDRQRPESECPWWLDLEEERAHAVDIKRHKVADLDFDLVRQYVNNTLKERSVLGTEICRTLGWPPSKYGKKIKEWLQELGWTPSEKATRDGWMFYAPDDWRPGAGGLGVHTGTVDMSVLAAISDDG